MIFFSTILLLNLGMFLFLSTYEINHKLGYTNVDGMVKFSRKLDIFHNSIISFVLGNPLFDYFFISNMIKINTS